MLLISGCQLKPLPGGLPGTGVPQDGVSQTIPFILGQLVDGAGQPVEGATVRAYVAPYRVEGLSTEPVASVETTTDAHGAFKLKSPPLGSVAVEARGHGQKALRTGVVVTSGAQVEVGTLALQPTGAIAGRVTSATGMTLLGTDVFIPGTDYLAKSAADGSYRLQDVPVGTYALAAIRPSFQPHVIQGVRVEAGQTTMAPDLELSLDAPVLKGLDPQSGGPGTVVTLRGENFGASKLTTFHVTFNDTMAVTARRISDTEIQATVPVGATTGAVVVQSNGIASTGIAFQVISRLTLMPNNVGLYPGTSYQFTYRALNDRGEVVPDPFVAWALRDPTLGSIGAQGLFQPKGEGATEIEVRSGVIEASAWVGVSRFEISTAFGNGQLKASGNEGLAAEAGINQPYTLARDAQGNLYVGEAGNTIIRKISPDGVISHFAGNAQAGATGDGGPAALAGLGIFSHIEVGEDQRLWISDGRNHVIRFVPLDDRGAPERRAGYIYTAAGTGAAGYAGSGLPALQSTLNAPAGLCVLPDGLCFADKFNHRLRRLTLDGRVLDLVGTGVPALMAAPAPAAEAVLDSPSYVAADAAGNLVIACVWQVVFWCRSSGTYFGRPMQAGTVYPLLTVDTSRVFQGDGLFHQVILTRQYPHGLAFDAAGACWFLDGPIVRRITTSGRVETVAGKPMEAAVSRSFGYDGDRVNALEGSFGNASDLVIVGDQLWVSDSSYNRIRLLRIPSPS